MRTTVCYDQPCFLLGRLLWEGRDRERKGAQESGQETRVQSLAFQRQDQVLQNLSSGLRNFMQGVNIGLGVPGARWNSGCHSHCQDILLRRAVGTNPRDLLRVGSNLCGEDQPGPSVEGARPSWAPWPVAPVLDTGSQAVFSLFGHCLVTPPAPGSASPGMLLLLPHRRGPASVLDPTWSLPQPVTHKMNGMSL